MDRSVWSSLAGTIARLAAGAARAGDVRAVRRALLIACIAGLVLPGAAHAFPGANGKIVFSSTRDDPNPTSCALTCDYELYTINPDGSGLARLTNTPAAVEAEPAWSPDGQRIVFQRGLGQTDIYVVDADGSDESLVIADGEEPGFSPDGTRVVFRRDPSDPNQGMNTVNLDGTGLHRIFVRGQDPAWSPDGSKIAIQETCCGGPGIATINSDGSGGELILDAGQQAGHDHPNWSPDGATVVYERYFSEPSGVYTVPRSGGTPSFLEFGFQPAWSPDGSKIVFESSSQLHVMNADGTGAVQIERRRVQQPPRLAAPARPQPLSAPRRRLTADHLLRPRLRAVHLTQHTAHRTAGRGLLHAAAAGLQPAHQFQDRRGQGLRAPGRDARQHRHIRRRG